MIYAHGFSAAVTGTCNVNWHAATDLAASDMLQETAVLCHGLFACMNVIAFDG